VDIDDKISILTAHCMLLKLHTTIIEIHRYTHIVWNYTHKKPCYLEQLVYH